MKTTKEDEERELDLISPPLLSCSDHRTLKQNKKRYLRLTFIVVPSAPQLLLLFPSPDLNE
jgi:hypothetical protein